MRTCQDDLKLRPPGADAFATIYEHPDPGKIDVGRIAKRTGNYSDAWSWCIRIGTLPVSGHRLEDGSFTGRLPYGSLKARQQRDG